jgi:hypothetical protein
VAGVEAGDATTPVDALFQLLRVEGGSFSFDPGATGPDARPEPLESLLADAQTRLSDWRAIEAVVPSAATSVRLADELPSPKVSVTAAQWRVLRTVAAGATVGDVAAAMELDEFGACQAVKRLVDAGLVEVEVAEHAGGRHASTPTTVDEDEDDEEENDDDEVDNERGRARDLDELVSIPAHMRRARRVPAPAPAPRRSRLAEAAARSRREPADDLVGAAAAALTPENANDLVRELAELGADVSEAAGVIEAASRTSSTEERTAALEGVLANDEGEPLNRALLMKFLSSVRS